MATSAITPPEGYTLETPQIVPPAGYTMEQAAPPGISRPAPDMQTSVLGTIYDKLLNAPTSGYTQSRMGEVPTASPDQNNSVLRGAEKGVTETLGGVSKHLGGPAATPVETQAEGAGETVGKIGETVMEFMAGDEAIKGLSLAKRFGIASKVADLAESSPKLAKALDIGMNAVRTGSVMGGQTYAKGGTVGESLQNASIGAVGGAALDTASAALPVGLRKLYNAVKPEDIKAGEVQQGVTDVVRGAAGVTEDVTPTAADPYGARQVASIQKGQYKAAANLLDKLSDNKFSEAQLAVEDSSNDFTIAGKQAHRVAEQELNSVIEQYRPEMESQGVDVSGMKDTYKASIANNKIANFLSSTVKESGKGSEVLTSQVKAGSQLREKILDLAQNQKDLLGKAGWTEDHINQAVQFARQMDSPEASKTLDVVSSLLRHKAGIGTIGGGIEGYRRGGLEGAVEGAATGAIAGYAFDRGIPLVSSLLWKIVSSPVALRAMNSGLATGASAKTVAPYVADELASDTGFMARLKQMYKSSPLWKRD